MRYTFNKTGALYKGDPNATDYNCSYAGNAMKVLFTRTEAIITDITPSNLIARGQNFDYSENYQILPVMEWNTYFIQETVLGLQEMGTFNVQVNFTLRTNDSLPTVRTLPFEKEMVVYEMAGDDAPHSGMVVNVWFGARFVGRGGGQTVNGILMDSIRGIYRYRLTGKDWKLLAPTDTYYPGDVQLVNME